MLLWAGDFRTVFWFAVIPAVLSVLLLMFGVREPESGADRRRPASHTLANAQRTGPRLLVGRRGRRRVHPGAL